jgi:hypothetical protein
MLSNLWLLGIRAVRLFRHLTLSLPGATIRSWPGRAGIDVGRRPEISCRTRRGQPGPPSLFQKVLWIQLSIASIWIILRRLPWTPAWRRRCPFIGPRPLVTASRPISLARRPPTRWSRRVRRLPTCWVVAPRRSSLPVPVPRRITWRCGGRPGLLDRAGAATTLSRLPPSIMPWAIPSINCATCSVSMLRGCRWTGMDS